MGAGSVSLTQVVLTRPDGQNDALIQALAHCGLTTIELPMLKLAPLDDSSAIESATIVMSKLSSYDYALFVSANAVGFAARFCVDHSIAWPSTLKCVGMGAATETAIADLGWQLLPQKLGGDASLSSEQMMQQPWAQQVAGSSVIVLKGKGGRHFMQHTLAGRGATVVELSLYRRERPEYAQEDIAESLSGLIESPQSSAIVLASEDTLNHWHHTLQQIGMLSLARQINLVLPSQRVADAARAKGYSRIHVAKGASNEAFFSAIEQAQRNLEP